MDHFKQEYMKISIQQLESDFVPKYVKKNSTQIKRQIGTCKITAVSKFDLE